MEIVWQANAWDDYYIGKKVISKTETNKSIIKDCQRNKFEGIGKPEQLKENLAGYWSRRIDNEHRLVYKIFENRLHIIQCRFHY
jgi:toxin YoeB